jgi:hypothetical protein
MLMQKLSGISGWKKALGAAIALVACEPFSPGPYGTCEDLRCSEKEYRLYLHEALPNYSGPDTTAGAFQLGQLPVTVSIDEDRTQSAGVVLSRPGCAYALSCMGCGDGFLPDSIHFTTAVMTPGGDTLPARYNFATQPLPAGFSGGLRGWLKIDSLVRFRDANFEIRFYGKIDSVPKSASRSVHIVHSSLLFP